MKKLFTLILTVFACVATYADVLAELTFPSSNDKGVSSYTADWTATNDYGTWNIVGFNNNNNAATWTYIRCGSKNAATTSSIETPVIEGNVTNVTITVDKTSGVSSATLIALNNGTEVSTENVTWDAGEVVVSLTGVKSGCTFKLVLENDKVASNGTTQISKITVNGSSDSSSDPVAVESVSLTDGNGNALSAYTMLTVTDELQVKAVVNPSNATNKKVTWEVMQQSEVISFENGVVKALAPGQAALVATTEDGEKQAATTFYVSAITDGTIADFIAAEGKTCYLTGVVSNIANTTYGNFDLTDESGTIYVYGCLNADGESKKFAELGISEGDKIKVLAREYKLYGETKEAVNVVFVENLGPVVEKEYTFEVVAGDTEFTVTPSDNEVLYYIELLPSEYNKEFVTNYFDGIFEEMGSGLEYFSGKQTQSYEEWYCDEGEEGNICICAVSNDYKRISEVSLIPFKYDTTTGITIANNAVKNAVIFNLNGQRISPSLAGKAGMGPKGIAIKNGKKFVQK